MFRGETAMNSNLLALPNECVINILSLLSIPEIRAIALTFNRHLFELAAPIFTRHWRPIVESEVYLEAFFGKPIRQMPDYPTRPSRHLKYLELADDFSWRAERNWQDREAWESDPSNVLYDEDLNRLIDIASQLGLTLPKAYIQLTRSQRRRDFFCDPQKVKVGRILKVEPESGCGTQLSHSLMPVSAYVLQFYVDIYEIDPAYHLYLDTAGRHAVLSSGTPIDIEDGMSATLDRGGSQDIRTIILESAKVTFENVNFEHWVMVQARLLTKCDSQFVFIPCIVCLDNMDKDVV